MQVKQGRIQQQLDLNPPVRRLVHQLQAAFRQERTNQFKAVPQTPPGCEIKLCRQLADIAQAQLAFVRARKYLQLGRCRLVASMLAGVGHYFIEYQCQHCRIGIPHHPLTDRCRVAQLQLATTNSLLKFAYGLSDFAV